MNEAIPEESPKERDRRKARERMKRLRLQGGGATTADRARKDAIKELIERHPGEFQLLLEKHRAMVK